MVSLSRRLRFGLFVGLLVEVGRVMWGEDMGCYWVALGGWGCYCVRGVGFELCGGMLTGLY